MRSRVTVHQYGGPETPEVEVAACGTVVVACGGRGAVVGVVDGLDMVRGATGAAKAVEGVDGATGAETGADDGTADGASTATAGGAGVASGWSLSVKCWTPPYTEAASIPATRTCLTCIRPI